MRIPALLNLLRTDSANVDDVRPTLWTARIGPASYRGDREHYQSAVLEQYKLYVEMADRVSARRALTNAFFLSLHSGILTGLGAAWRSDDFPVAFLFVLFAVGTVFAAAWLSLIVSYRQLNAAKYTVIGALEERLPAAPYSRAEWAALKQGTDKGRYWPLTYPEQLLPVVFALLYLTGIAVTPTVR
ncbi:hypothetical protein LO772_30810 [Yinghuangia sp. ASG 101]|uniref:RipA family octameric membrane protein n=1 Tax=Yinghuangia sp. ASG 101 TaxID=2896848 RepID=UPI001E535384|nr:hypothetical protein [Yinghuangia sp. ASG 101]UGQ11149.1 hypothetical protein LO772_30810 [Yinghuangia sp. ASG 101]